MMVAADRSKMLHRKVKDSPGREFEIISTSDGPYQNLFRLRLVGGTYEINASSYELQHYYT